MVLCYFSTFFRQLPKRLGLLHQALLTVQPTSTEAERSFSTSGNLVTKLRNRLKDSTIEDIIFVGGCYEKKKKT